jgi:hypothetical protein
MIGGPIGGMVGSELCNSLFSKSSSGTRTVSYPYQNQEVDIHQEQRTHEYENKPDFDYCYRLALEEYDKTSRNEMIIGNR